MGSLVRGALKTRPESGGFVGRTFIMTQMCLLSWDELNMIDVYQ